MYMGKATELVGLTKGRLKIICPSKETEISIAIFSLKLLNLIRETNLMTKLETASTVGNNKKPEGWGRDGPTIQYVDFYSYPVLEW